MEIVEKVKIKEQNLAMIRNVNTGKIRYIDSNKKSWFWGLLKKWL